MENVSMRHNIAYPAFYRRDFFILPLASHFSILVFSFIPKSLMAIIAVDCDEVLIESLRNLIDFSRDIYNHSWIYEDFRDYFISKNDHVHLTDQEAIKLFDDYFTSTFAETAPPVVGAKEKLLQLKND